jgi:copper chaperone CopZ
MSDEKKRRGVHSFFKIQGYHIMGIRKLLKNLEGVADADVAVGSARVSYDDAKVSADAMRKIIERAGYTVKK